MSNKSNESNESPSKRRISINETRILFEIIGCKEVIALFGFDEVQEKIMYLRLHEGRAYQDIADEVGLSPASVNKSFDAIMLEIVRKIPVLVRQYNLAKQGLEMSLSDKARYEDEMETYAERMRIFNGNPPAITVMSGV